MRAIHDLGTYQISRDAIVSVGGEDLNLSVVEALGISARIDAEFDPSRYQFRGAVIPRSSLDSHFGITRTHITPLGYTAHTAVYHALKNRIVPGGRRAPPEVENDPICVVLVYDPERLTRDIRQGCVYEVATPLEESVLALFHWDVIGML